MQQEPPTRDAWIEIDLSAIKHNMAVAKKCAGKAKVCAVVKADAYGHGAVPVAKAAVEAGAYYLAVATVDEAVQLREANIKAPILLLSEPPIRSIERIFQYENIIPTVTTVDFAIEYGRLGKELDKAAPFHLKINTGMNRLGVHYTEAVEFLNTINVYASLRLDGVFTHFATADTTDDWDFRRQVQRFNEAVAAIKLAGWKPELVHCSNSAATLRFPSLAHDMVRCGVMLYGLHPSTLTYGQADLRPAMSVHAKVTHVCEPAVGEGVSYGMIYRSPGNVQICTLPLGYADGLSRCLSEKMNVIYKGHVLPQVGRICMDQCMFEAPISSELLRRNPMPAVQVGDEVLIVGETDGAKITLDMLAAQLGTINYEVACSFGMRLPKLYV